MTGGTIKTFLCMDGDVRVRLASDSSSWLSSILSYLSPMPEENSPARPHISLVLREAGEEALPGLMPLPGEEYLKTERTLLVDRPVAFRTYEKDGERLTDFEGMGRTRVNRREGRAEAIKVTNSGISTVYSDIVLAYNPLLSLLYGRGAVPVHASCVEINGKGVLFTGKSGSGKSTAAFAMIARGRPVLADDRVLLRKSPAGYSAFSLSDVVKLTRETLEKFFPALCGAKPLHRVKNEFYFKAASSPGMRRSANAEISCLVFFERTGKPESVLERVNPAHSVGSLFPVTLGDFSPRDMRDKFGFIMDMLGEIPCFKASFGTDMVKFAEAVEDMVCGSGV